MSNSSNIISLNITKFPQNILIPDMDNDVSIQATNNSNKNENFRFVFEGENLDVYYKSEPLNDQVEFAANETKSIDLKLNPTVSGSGKLIINGFWLKIVEYTVKVQKVRETVPKNKLNKKLENYKFKGTEKIDSIDPKEYLLGMTLKEIQTAEEQLETMKKNYNLTLSSNSTNSEAFTRVTIEVIEKTIKQLAKGYLSNNNIQNALGIALELSDPNDRINFYVNLIRAYAFENMNDAVQIIRSLNDVNLQQSLLKSLIFDQASHNPIPALTLITGIIDSSTKIILLFNIAKQLNNDNNSSELSKILRKTIETVLKSIGLNNEDKKDQKFFYESLKDAINGIAEIENPVAANNIIEGIDNQTLKESITKDLFDMVYELVDEIRTKIESELVFSQFFLLNTYISNITNEIKSFSNIGGNVSSNILSGDFNFNLIFLSLFRFDFSIFPFIDRVSSDLKFNMKKSIGYYIFPSVDNFQNNELNVLQKTLQQFFNNFANVPNQLLIFNLDFIPYLGKPTVILSSESQLSNTIKSKIEKLGDSVNLIIDDSMFKGGEIYDNLRKIIPSNKGEIFNLILSYEFINDYNVFKAFIQSLF
ncbi:MAG: hypothetical protein KGD58_06720 [Candidatus Lokiarchaeota archaeon]|nr:hypothetical protein [Candidatus Lokiarchaeota archaeon]